ncbi:MAG: uracil-DNA glycosylase [Campylobacterota bacterium]
MLQNLYRLKALGFSYSDPFVTNRSTVAQELPDDLLQLQEIVSQCHLCDLSKSRQQSMSGLGNLNADLMIIDAYVSISEDASNSYYAGKSGESLVKMIENVLGRKKEDVYITHAVKCKPLGTNTPSKSEFNSCKPYLYKQIEMIRPKVIMTLGEEAYHLISGDDTPFEQIRGQKINFGDYVIIPIFHPQFLLRNPSMKGETLSDLKTIKSCL